jgi:hypothetical protein
MVHHDIHKINNIIENSLDFFNHNFHLKIQYPNQIFNYTVPDYKLIADESFVCLTEIRRPDDKGKKYSLPKFRNIGLVNLNPKINGCNANILLSYIKNFCHAKMEDIGIVGLSQIKELNITGVEPYLELFASYGIKKENIHIRNDIQNAFNLGNSDGWIKYPTIPPVSHETMSVYVKLKKNSKIKNYENNEEWLRLYSFSSKFGAIGMERILYYYFNIKNIFE